MGQQTHIILDFIIRIPCNLIALCHRFDHLPPYYINATYYGVIVIKVPIHIISNHEDVGIL